MRCTHVAAYACLHDGALYVRRSHLCGASYPKGRCKDSEYFDRLYKQSSTNRRMGYFYRRIVVNTFGYVNTFS